MILFTFSRFELDFMVPCFAISDYLYFYGCRRGNCIQSSILEVIRKNDMNKSVFFKLQFAIIFARMFSSFMPFLYCCDRQLELVVGDATIIIHKIAAAYQRMVINFFTLGLAHSISTCIAIKIMLFGYLEQKLMTNFKLFLQKSCQICLLSNMQSSKCFISLFMNMAIQIFPALSQIFQTILSLQEFLILLEHISQIKAKIQIRRVQLMGEM